MLLNNVGPHNGKSDHCEVVPKMKMIIFFLSSSYIGHVMGKWYLLSDSAIFAYLRILLFTCFYLFCVSQSADYVCLSRTSLMPL